MRRFAPFFFSIIEGWLFKQFQGYFKGVSKDFQENFDVSKRILPSSTQTSTLTSTELSIELISFSSPPPPTHHQGQVANFDYIFDFHYNLSFNSNNKTNSSLAQLSPSLFSNFTVSSDKKQIYVLNLIS